MDRRVGLRGWILAAAVAVVVAVGIGRAWIVDDGLPFVTPHVSVADVNARGEVLVTSAVRLAP